MRYRLMFITGLTIGYVLGARAGRERYEQLRTNAREVARNPAVRNTVESAARSGRQFASKAADTMGSKIGDHLPEAVTDRVRSLRGRRGLAAEDDWGTPLT